MNKNLLNRHFREEKIDLNELKQTIFKGYMWTSFFSEDYLINCRAECWKILLGYTPLEADKRNTKINNMRDNYLDLVNEFIFNPYSIEELEDHPLNNNENSTWVALMRDKNLTQQVGYDTMRLNFDVNLFNSETKFPLSSFARVRSFVYV
uniref:TBC1 domain family member 13 (Trinotate prediction) n=1 Tax=Henneguya salminicola TaxID=69463 RepID=A0A6G3MFY0_HENSL